MDPEFARGSPPSWLFQRGKQPPTRDLPWGVHSFWTDDGKGLRLRIDRIGSEQAGEYACKAGTLSRTVEVRVNKGVIVLTCITSNTSARRGSTTLHTTRHMDHYLLFPISLTAPILSHKSSISKCKCDSSKLLFCTFQGDPAPNITWLRDGQQLDRGAPIQTFSYPIGVDGDYIVFSILLLSPITMVSAGLYQCRAINERGSAVVDIGQLQGKRAPPAAWGDRCHLQAYTHVYYVRCSLKSWASPIHVD